MFHMEPGDGGKEGDRCKQRRRERERASRAPSLSINTLHLPSAVRQTEETAAGRRLEPVLRLQVLLL